MAADGSRTTSTAPAPSRTAPTKVLGDSAGEKAAVIVIGIMALTLAVAGMAVSFEVVWGQMKPWFHQVAFVVPLGVDLAIMVFSAADLLATYWGMRLWWLRLVPIAFTAATIILNVAAGGPLPVLVAHAAMPSLWVVFVEFVRAVVNYRIKQVANVPFDRVPTARWLLAPRRTAALWRRMKLWNIHSYDQALREEARRLIRLAYLEQEHGKRWRKKAPVKDLLAVRLLDVAPAEQAGALLREFAGEQFSMTRLLLQEAERADPSAASDPMGGRRRRQTGSGTATTAAAVPRQVPAQRSELAQPEPVDQGPVDQEADDLEPGEEGGEAGEERRNLPKMRQDAKTVYLAYRAAGRELTPRRMAALSGYTYRQSGRLLERLGVELGPITVTVPENDKAFAEELAEKLDEGLVLEVG